ncbi:NAD-dependent epimerase/dehydratase family protein [Truepera radiovictrix]|uniref:NAD-dependent epimerase/dehydratase n=1 Tax=Truepera radiovictrix (strain DSM 17093 / CIP 108686 / LMG 22925 / RQ-24) TaxID=649638 RepID=D7CXU5_TRURR|nr:NAD(P)-dependent oxidoreductase [Truepera radiovictrix]ADI13305.1 NAD-dependent epimerase/dehydratase [Truepera radiovictrix DSM 17093]WMT58131.1 NAD(P)-dependent oxidoreductase [Truepera radiovictrix]
MTLAELKVVVTGSSGRAGRAVVRGLKEQGLEVLGVDRVKPLEDPGVPTLQADLTDLGETLEVLKGADAVVHLANIPAPGIFPPGRTFVENTVMNYNVFSAAVDVGLGRVVWASSETTLGLPFDTPPRYAPVDEAHYPVPESSYALSKVASETLAEQFARWSGVPFIGLRFSNILSEREYRTFPETCWRDPAARKWNLWGYVDERDVALACRLSLTAHVTGADALIIAANDTVMNRPSRELMAEVFPGVPVADDLPEYGTLLSVERARRTLGYEPAHSWREVLEGERVG